MLCNMAWRNGEAVPLGGPLMLDRCDLPIPLRVGSFEPAGLSFAEWQLPLTAKDSEIGLGNPNGDLSFITILRNPLDQALAHYKHVEEDFKGLFHNFTSFIEYGECLRRVDGPKASSCTQFLSPEQKWAHAARLHDKRYFAVFQNNQQLRWLEPQLSDSRELEINADRLAAAVRRLELFDEIFILEEFHSIGRFRMQHYGWNDLDDEADMERGWHRHRSNASAELPAPVLAKLSEVQQWDLQLYEHARKIAKTRQTALTL